MQMFVKADGKTLTVEQNIVKYTNMEDYIYIYNITKQFSVVLNGQNHHEPMTS